MKSYKCIYDRISCISFFSNYLFTLQNEQIFTSYNIRIRDSRISREKLGVTQIFRKTKFSARGGISYQTMFPKLRDFFVDRNRTIYMVGFESCKCRNFDKKFREIPDNPFPGYFESSVSRKFLWSSLPGKVNASFFQYSQKFHFSGSLRNFLIQTIPLYAIFRSQELKILDS